MPSLSWEILRLIALVVVFLPVLVVNLRNGTLPNWGSLAVLVAGIAIALFRHDAVDLPWLFWVGGLVVWLALFAALRVPAGLVKIGIAFLPWFEGPGEYLVFFIVAMLIVGAAGVTMRFKTVPFAPGLMISALGLFVVTAAV
jgi:Flp pilus assembly protein protease CpaA